MVLSLVLRVDEYGHAYIDMSPPMGEPSPQDAAGDGFYPVQFAVERSGSARDRVTTQRGL